ncbi:MAG: hypothetical protein E7448_06205, partial [Ruminococcaceae bacterium]|nr:hypothetical protein [Oscillospiraceae bacterium]
MCAECGYIFDWESTFSAASAGTYKITKGFTPRTDAPYDDATQANFCASPGGTVEVLGDYRNAYGSKWYKFKMSGGVYYVYESYLSFSGYSQLQISCTGFSPAHNAVLEKKSYPVKGTVTANYPLKKIEAYLDGTKFATWTSSNESTTTVSLRDTEINTKLKFAELPEGKHTIVLKAFDYVHSTGVQFHNSVFYIGETACTHSYTYKATTVPTTSTGGTITGTCSKCGETEIIALPKLTTSDYSYKVVTAATCTAAGTGRYTWKTTTYGSFSFDVSISANGHSYANATCTTAQKCTVCGGTTGSALGHNYNNGVVTKSATCTAAGVKTYTCQTCGEAKTETISATGHSWVNATCTESKTCSVCRTTEGQAPGHIPGDPIVENYVPASCGKNGSYDFVIKCSNANCDHEIGRNTVVVPATGAHNYAYTNNGNNTHTYACSGCGDSVTEAHSYTNNACACGHTLIDLIKSSQATLEAMLRLDFTVDKSL